MSTLLDELQQGHVPHYLSEIALTEELEPQQLIQGVSEGKIVVPRNRKHKTAQAIAIGSGTSVKVNANIGTSPSACDFEHEIDKAKTAVASGADAIMDLSIAGDAPAFRRKIMEELPVTLGTVPLYEAMSSCRGPEDLNLEKFLNTVKQQAEEGVDFMTIHAGLRQQHLALLNTRELGVVSRGGAVMAQWMRCHGRENFL
jgi:phosphomethylpyrimidine synthase